MTVVYIDVLFLINFCMDFLALILSGSVMHLEVRRGYLTAAAALGGVYAVLAALFPGNAAVGAVIGGAVAYLLCYIAYGRACRGGTFFCVFFLFYAMSCLLGGMITGAYEFLRGFFEHRADLFLAITEGDGKIAFFFTLLFSCGFLLTLFKRHFNFKKEKRSVSVTFVSDGSETTVSALVDSGNMLCDPLSGRSCIVVTPETARAILPGDVLALAERGDADVSRLSARSGRRLRMIPAETVTGHRLLVGYRVDQITVNAGNGSRATDALLVIGSCGDEYGGHAALIPSILT